MFSCAGGIVPVRWKACAVGRRFKSFRLNKNFKGQTVTWKPATQLALEHFDFYYRPIFRDSWPSIRLAMLSAGKHCALVNGCLEHSPIYQHELEQSGAFDLIDLLRRGGGGLASTDAVQPDAEETFVVDTPCAPVPVDLQDRDETGLDTFLQPTQEWARDQLQTIQPDGAQVQRKAPLELDFRLHSLPTEPVDYPEKLKVMYYARGAAAEFPEPEGAVSSWALFGGASLLPVLALDVRDGDRVLDLCASPGGKSLAILFTGRPEAVVCNDWQRKRVARLKRTLRMFMPETHDWVERVSVTRRDAAVADKWEELEQYDRVLVDAPSTSDRKSLLDNDCSIFRPSFTSDRIRLPELQTELLVCVRRSADGAVSTPPFSTGLRALKPGGSLVYTTNTLAPLQNENVVLNATAAAARRYGIDTALRSLNALKTDLVASRMFRLYDNCRIGALVLPFLPCNYGPVYFCKLQRMS